MFVAAQTAFKEDAEADAAEATADVEEAEAKVPPIPPTPHASHRNPIYTGIFPTFVLRAI